MVYISRFYTIQVLLVGLKGSLSWAAWPSRLNVIIIIYDFSSFYSLSVNKLLEILICTYSGEITQNR